MASNEGALMFDTHSTAIRATAQAAVVATMQPATTDFTLLAVDAEGLQRFGSIIYTPVLNGSGSFVGFSGIIFKCVAETLSTLRADSPRPSHPHASWDSVLQSTLPSFSACRGFDQPARAAASLAPHLVPAG